MTTICSFLLFLLFLLTFLRTLFSPPRRDRLLWGSLASLTFLLSIQTFGFLHERFLVAFAVSLVILALAHSQQAATTLQQETERLRSDLEARLHDCIEERDHWVRAHQLYRSLTTLAARGQEETTLLHDFCQALVTVGIFRLVWIGEAQGKRILPLAQAGFEKGYLETLGLTPSERDERGRGPTATAYRTGQPAVVQNIRTDPAFRPWKEEAEKRGYGSVLSIPLRVGDRRLVLSLYACEPQAFAEEEIALLREAATIIEDGIGRIRPFERVIG